VGSNFVFGWLLAVDAEPQVLTHGLLLLLDDSLARHGTGTPLNPIRVEYVQQRSNLRVLERSFGCKALGDASRGRSILNCISHPRAQAAFSQGDFATTQFAGVGLRIRFGK
jgi:hypothetical protein